MGLRILVVDDEDGVLRIRKEQLESEGHEVLTASDGAEGLDRVETEGKRIDLILCDGQMPVMDGLEMLKRVRIVRPGIPFIMISGFQKESFRQEVLASGANDFLLKPVTMKKLSAAILLAVGA